LKTPAPIPAPGSALGSLSSVALSSVRMLEVYLKLDFCWLKERHFQSHFLLAFRLSGGKISGQWESTRRKVWFLFARPARRRKEPDADTIFPLRRAMHVWLTANLFTSLSTRSGDADAPRAANVYGSHSPRESLQPRQTGCAHFLPDDIPAHVASERARQPCNQLDESIRVSLRHECVLKFPVREHALTESFELRHNRLLLTPSRSR
jgi:hypothetical protein